MNTIEFELYRTEPTLKQRDIDFFRRTVDFDTASDTAVSLVTAITLPLIEQPFDAARYRLLVDSFHRELGMEELNLRVVVGVLLTMISHNDSFRSNWDALNDAQEVLCYHPALSMLALECIARTSLTPRIDSLNEKMAKEILPFLQNPSQENMMEILKQHQFEIEHIATMRFDQSYALFRRAYTLPFFRDKVINWFLTWSDDMLDDLQDDIRDKARSILPILCKCDSDKFALLCICRISQEMITQLPAALDKLESPSEENIEVENYVRRLYRYYTLSPFTQSRPFAHIDRLRDTLAYHLVAVGKEAQKRINDILSV